MDSQKRLLSFIRNEMSPGSCRICSLGDSCKCPLCDYDKIIEKTARLEGWLKQLWPYPYRKIITDELFGEILAYIKAMEGKE